MDEFGYAPRDSQGLNWWVMFEEKMGGFTAATHQATIALSNMRPAFMNVTKAFNSFVRVMFDPEQYLDYRRVKYGGNSAFAREDNWISDMCGAWLHDSCRSYQHRLECTCRCHRRKT